MTAIVGPGDFRFQVEAGCAKLPIAGRRRLRQLHVPVEDSRRARVAAARLACPYDLTARIDALLARCGIFRKCVQN